MREVLLTLVLSSVVLGGCGSEREPRPVTGGRLVCEPAGGYHCTEDLPDGWGVTGCASGWTIEVESNCFRPADGSGDWFCQPAQCLVRQVATVTCAEGIATCSDGSVPACRALDYDTTCDVVEGDCTAEIVVTGLSPDGTQEEGVRACQITITR